MPVLVDVIDRPPTLPFQMTALPSLEPVWQKIETHHEEAEKGHERLRKDYRALDDRIERLEHDHVAIGRRIDRVENTPPNIEKMAWTTKQLIVIVVVAFGLGGGMLQLHVDIDRAETAAVNAAKLQDERNAAMDKALAAALAESRLNGLKTDDLSKQLTTYLLQHTR